MTNTNDSRQQSFQGSTYFFTEDDGAGPDPYTPSYDQAKPLVGNIQGPPVDDPDFVPPWYKSDSPKPPAEQYVDWFNGIWHTGDPSQWNAKVFTSTATMIDPTGVSVGAQQAADNFKLIFKYYPELRGEVVSWAANEREIFINWRFKVKSKKDGTPLLVPVLDKFCFDTGRVSFRQAYFDIPSLIGYLSANYGHDHLFDFLRATMKHALATGGVQQIPYILWRFISGIFYWSRPVQTPGLTATAGDGSVLLEWDPVEAPVRIKRAVDPAGDYQVITAVNSEATSYEDTTVEIGTSYWYAVEQITK